MSFILHIRIKGKRTTASMNHDLADLLAVKLAGKRAKDATRVLSRWAQVTIDRHLVTSQPSRWLTYYALLEIADQALQRSLSDILLSNTTN
ncbi:MAG: hypothetical protein D6816_11735 [Bacteroidetes bacterium]|nr:MAG: hypothetical protein D6816_11735 [Bacteroidota bacterium]